MRYALALTVCLFSVGLAHAEWPFSDTKATAWPFTSKPCDCNPCTCDPAKCTCSGCANGCRKAGGAEVAYVGDDPFQTTPTTVEESKPTAPQGYHTEYRKVCNGTSCQMVPVTVADAPSSPASGCASCATGGCGTSGSVTGGCSSCSSGTGRSGFLSRGPIRHFLFRGRCR